MVINGYTLKTELNNANSGFSKWGFVTKGGREYFIKELISPVYPMDASVMTEELFNQKRDYCHEFEKRFQDFYGKINRVSRGNLVRVIEFFRSGSRYYLVSEKIEGESVSFGYISSFAEEKKLLLLKTVAYCFYDLHYAGIVHFDVKPANILVKRSANGNLTAKLIDFDSGFFKGEIPDDKELGGDLTYLAPETFLGIIGENVKPDEKSDIFALGLVFHEYFCGKLPYFDNSQYDYPYEAALDGGGLVPDMSMMPVELGNLISSMLDVEPSNRPSAEDIVKTLHMIYHANSYDIPVPKPTPEPATKSSTSDKTATGSSDGWFSRAGDL